MDSFRDAHSSPRVHVSAISPRGWLRFCVLGVDQGRERAETARKGYLESVLGLTILNARCLLLERSFLSFFSFLFFDLLFLSCLPSSFFISSPPPSPPKQTETQQFHPGTDVGRGTDDTLFALTEGIVVFKVTKHERSVSVVPADEFEVPEGQRRAETSRRTKRLAQYTPRAAQREAVAAAAAAVAVPAAP